MFITKRHMSRRTVLKGMGVGLSLPLLESMLPAQTPLRDTAAATRTRLFAIEVPHGAGGSCVHGRKMNYWSPVKEGSDFDFTTALEPLEPFRDYVTVISDTDCANAAPTTPEEVGGDHSRSAAVFLSGAHPKMTEGADFYCGTTIDQLYAQKYGQDTPLPSLELGIEDTGSLVGSCGFGYSCVYKYSVSWASPSKPLPMQIDPRVAFERLFGDGGSPEQRMTRRQEDRSVLDTIVGKIARLRKDLDAGDRNRLNEYVDGVRELERRIQMVERHNSTGEARELPAAPIGVPDSFDEHVKLMCDLTVLGFQAEVTRVSALMLARDVSPRVFPESGSKSPFHSGSHHGEQPDQIEDFTRINRYHVSLMAYLLNRMQYTPDGDGNLLDHSLVLYGSPMGNGHIHEHKRCPLFLAGHANGQLRGNYHLRTPEGTPMANALLAVLDKLGIEQESIGDSTGMLTI